MRLTADQLRRFDNDGFLNYGPLLQQDEVIELTEHIEHVLATAKPEDNQAIRHIESARGPAAGTIKQIMNASDYDPFFARWMTDRRLLDLAESLVGHNPRSWDEVIYKPAGDGAATPWHQDNAYYRLQPANAITFWIPLTEASGHTGSMQFIPGSHKWGLGHHRTGLKEIFAKQLHLADETPSVPVILPAGGLSIHHCLTAHSATRNLSSNARPVYIIRYVGQDCRSLPLDE